MLCTCGQGVEGQWEACKNAECPIEWFHWECVGILYDMEGEWVCPRCRVEPAADSEDEVVVSPRRDSSVAVLPKLDNTGQKASKPDQQGNNVTMVTKARPRRKTSQRASRIVYETTETSIFENIIAESRAVALQIKEATKGQEDDKIQQAAKGLGSEGQREESREEESIELLVRKMRAKVERG